MNKLYWYVAHVEGKGSIGIVATSAKAARAQIMAAENCPAGAIRWLRNKGRI